MDEPMIQLILHLTLSIGLVLLGLSALDLRARQRALETQQDALIDAWAEFDAQVRQTTPAHNTKEATN